jgi:hypothetical protein
MKRMHHLHFFQVSVNFVSDQLHKIDMILLLKLFALACGCERKHPCADIDSRKRPVACVMGQVLECYVGRPP